MHWVLLSSLKLPILGVPESGIFSEGSKRAYKNKTLNCSIEHTRSGFLFVDWDIDIVTHSPLCLLLMLPFHISLPLSQSDLYHPLVTLSFSLSRSMESNKLTQNSFDAQLVIGAHKSSFHNNCTRIWSIRMFDQKSGISQMKNEEPNKLLLVILAENWWNYLLVMHTIDSIDCVHCPLHPILAIHYKSNNNRIIDLNAYMFSKLKSHMIIPI